MIARFLPTEAHLTETILGALEQWSGEGEEGAGLDGDGGAGSMKLGWEERYVMLLWLAHLLYAPFDLATFSQPGALPSESLEADPNPMPLGLPSLAIRLVRQGTKYLAVPGKERDAAKTLLSRLVLRRDMQSYGLLSWLMTWCIRSLRQQDRINIDKPYLHTGIVSLLGFLVQSDDSGTVIPFYRQMHDLLSATIEGDFATNRPVSSSALLRKAVAKALRAMNVQVLKYERTGTSQHLGSLTGLLEDSIETLLRFLSDTDAPVRLAASKALSQIAAELPPDMVADLVDTIQQALDQDCTAVPSASGDMTGTGVDLNAVDPHFWHGLTLTIAQLLFRRLPTPQQLPQLQQSLLTALQFHQQAVGGTFRGVGVRDAACFGIWSIARRYSTAELLAFQAPGSANAIEAFAVALLGAGCLDPSGNIRRASSAALQELIGRHPDVVAEGIALVQAVDYLAVARRVRALQQVAPQAAALAPIYRTSLLRALKGWRGIRSDDATSRRLAAECIGALLEKNRREGELGMMMDLLMEEAIASSKRDIDLLHGSLLTIARLVELECSLEHSDHSPVSGTQLGFAEKLASFLGSVTELIIELIENHILGPQLMIEAASSLIQANVSWLKKISALPSSTNLQTMCRMVQICVVHSTDTAEPYALNAALAVSRMHAEPTAESLDGWIREGRSLSKRIGSAEGSLTLIKLLGHLAQVDQHDAKSSISSQKQQELFDVLLELASSKTLDITARANALSSLSIGGFIYEETVSRTLPVMIDFTQDYSTDERGDVGSLLRIAAIEAAFILWLRDQQTAEAQDHLQWRPEIQTQVFRLAGDRLDKVRQKCGELLVMLHQRMELYDPFTGISFRHLLDLSRQSPAYEESFMEGFLSICGSGAENVMRSARSTLVSGTGPGSDRHLQSVYTSISAILDRGRTEDRLILPSLEVLSFLLATQPLTNWSATEWRRLMSRLQKSHYQSGSVSKLLAAVHCYGGMLQAAPIRGEALKKLQSMLLFPFPTVRAAAAEVLYLETKLHGSVSEQFEDLLMSADWMGAPRTLKSTVLELARCQTA